MRILARLARAVVIGCGNLFEDQEIAAFDLACFSLFSGLVVGLASLALGLTLDTLLLGAEQRMGIMP